MRKNDRNNRFVELGTLLSATLTNTLVWALGCGKPEPGGDDDSGFGSMSPTGATNPATMDPGTDTGGGTGDDASTTSASTTSASTTGASTTSTSTTSASTTSTSTTSAGTSGVDLGGSSGGASCGDSPGAGDPTTAYNECSDCMDPNCCQTTPVGSMCVMSCTMPQTQAECPGPKNGTSEPLCSPSPYGDICVLVCETNGEPSNCPTGMECSDVGGTVNICLWP